MCSTFKLLLAAQTLTAAKNGVSLRTPLPFTRADLLPYSPGAERLLDALGSSKFAALAQHLHRRQGGGRVRGRRHAVGGMHGRAAG